MWYNKYINTHKTNGNKNSKGKQMSAKEINQSDWQESVIDSNKPVLVDFYAPWCGPCKMLAPVIDKIAKEFSGLVSVVKVNTDICSEIAVQYGVSAMPSVFIFNNGKLISKIIGVNPENRYRSELDKILPKKETK